MFLKQIEALPCHYAISNPQVTWAYGWYDEDDILQAVCIIGKPSSHGLCLLCGPEYADKVYELNRLELFSGLSRILSLFLMQTLS